jgi:formylglycine-generating enzyme required for sulfatase activity
VGDPRALFWVITASVITVLAIGAAACSLAYPLGRYEGTSPAASAADGAIGDGEATDDGGVVVGVEAGGDAGASACPDAAGGPMVPSAGFCIDVHETTQREYEDFVNANVPVATQAAVCSANATFAPGVGATAAANGCAPSFFSPATKPSKPVVCVDWCDALAYCAWAGKRLCGRIGGGSVGAQEYLDVTRDQWFSACTRGGAHPYPYGDAFDDQACNGAGFGANALVDVGSIAKCVGGFDGIFDMSGNAWEWEDACSPADGGVACRLRGGSFGESTAGKLRCDSNAQVNSEAIDFMGGNVGFRCCE